MNGLDFHGRTVWITGAGKGIGYATALAFVEAGAQVTGFDLAFDGESYPFATETLDVADAQQVAQRRAAACWQGSRGWMCWSMPPVFCGWGDRCAEPGRLAADLCR